MTNTEETIYSTRAGGNTSVLIGILLQNPNAKMVVHTYDFAKQLSRKYQLPMDRFITVSKLEIDLCDFSGPVVFDLPAIAYLVDMEVKRAIKKCKDESEDTFTITISRNRND